MLKIAVIVFVSLLMPVFNNCGGTKYQPASESDAASISGLNHDVIATDVSVLAFKSSNQIADNLPLAINTAYEFRLVGDNLAPTAAKWTTNCTMTGSDMLTRSITCASVGTIQVQVDLDFANQPSMSRTFSRNVTATEVVTPPSNIVVFNIPAGTARGRWNAVTAPAVAFVGQTLRITNQDAMAHRLHTGGNPCPHQGPNIATGQFYDCVVTRAHLGTATDTYDHNIGTAAGFAILTIDGAAVYAQKFNVAGQMRSCADCHGALATSAKKNATFASIRAAISGNQGGMGAITLTDDQVRALAYQLSR